MVAAFEARDHGFGHSDAPGQLLLRFTASGAEGGKLACEARGKRNGRVDLQRLVDAVSVSGFTTSGTLALLLCLVNRRWRG